MKRLFVKWYLWIDVAPILSSHLREFGNLGVDQLEGVFLIVEVDAHQKRFADSLRQLGGTVARNSVPCVSHVPPMPAQFAGQPRENVS